MKSAQRSLIAILLVVAAGASASAQQSVTAEHFVVVSGHPDATAAGLEVLRDGGNVMDAAVAASLCVGVAEPYGSGLGGKLMLLYREAATGRVYSIEAVCAAPHGLNANRFVELRSRERYFGYTAVAVPGYLAGLHAAYERWGSKPWQELVEPAAELAEHGVKMTDKSRQFFRQKVLQLSRDNQAARLYLVDGDAPPVGTLLKNAELGQSLRLIADQGPAALYGGEIGRRIVDAAQSAGVPLALEDFRTYQPHSVEPLAINYHGYEIYSCPPPLTGGTTVLATLRALEHLDDVDAADGRDAEYVDRVGRVLLEIYPRVNRTIADVPTALADARSLLGAKTARQISAAALKVDPTNPYATPVRPTAGVGATEEHSADDLPDASTTHLTVADSQGNIVCLTQSLSYHFGACVIAPGTGILLNNSMSNYSTRNPLGVNHVAPGKRERSTIAPIVATRDGRPALALGIPGGQRIPTTTLQLLVDILDGGVPLVDAFARPRFHVRRPVGPDEFPNIVDLEDDAPATLDGELQERGWKTVRKRRDGSYFGGGNAIVFRPDGTLEGVADLRRTNFAAGQ